MICIRLDCLKENIESFSIWKSLHWCDEFSNQIDRHVLMIVSEVWCIHKCGNENVISVNLAVWEAWKNTGISTKISLLSEEGPQNSYVKQKTSGITVAESCGNTWLCRNSSDCGLHSDSLHCQR
jgi:hypothetical protein